MIRRIERTKIMHRVVESNGTLYLGGLIADDTSLDMEGQTRQICRKIEALLVQGGSSKNKILAAQIFVTDIGAKDALNKVWTEWLGEDELPARATVGVSSLGSPQTLVEIVVTAAV